MTPARTQLARPILVSVGSVLFLAGALKMAALFSSRYVAQQSDFELITESGGAALEITLAMWTFSAVAQVANRLAVSGLFTCFAFLNGWRLIAGETSCNCFGETPFPTFALLLFDMALLVVVLWARPSDTWEGNDGLFYCRLLIVGFGLGIFSGAFALATSQRISSGDVFDVATSRIVVPMNDRTGVPLETLLNITRPIDGEEREQLLTPETLFLLITRDSCPSCDRVLDDLIRDPNQPQHYRAAVLRLSATAAGISNDNRDSELARMDLVCLRVDEDLYEIIAQVPAIVKYERGEFRGFRGGVSSWQPY